MIKVRFLESGNAYGMSFAEWKWRSGKDTPSVNDVIYQGDSNGVKVEVRITEVDATNNSLTVEVSTIDKYPWE